MRGNQPVDGLHKVLLIVVHLIKRRKPEQHLSRHVSFL